MYCKKCGKEVPDNSSFCKYCGTNLENEKTLKNISNIKAQVEEYIDKFKTEILPKYKVELKTNRKTQIISGVVCACTILLLVFTFNSVTLNSNERVIYNGCKEIKSRLKNPDSFTLPDEEALVFTSGDGTETYIVFTYGGANSYGGIVTSEAVFRDGEYIMDYEDYDETNMDHIETKMALELYKYSIVSKGTKSVESNTTFVNLNKIKHKLGLN